MNINDFKSPEVTGDRLEMIFERQLELIKKYLDIEEKNGLVFTRDIPVNIHTHMGQARLKMMAWNVVEELAEALDAFDLNEKEHGMEEIADGLHFLVELMILAGISPDDILSPLVTVDDSVDRLGLIFTVAYGDIRHRPHQVKNFIKAIGMACNCLKNKPWKQSQMMTDEKQLRNHLIKAFYKYISICRSCYIDEETLFDLYFRKSEVNKFRQRSGY